MKNIINEKPSKALHGRALYNTAFLEDGDVVNKRILDIGCGYGWFELNVADRACGTVIGIELLEQNLETAKANIDNEKIDFTVGSAIDLPFENESFDTVVAWEVIEHIPKQTEGKMFQEVGRVLKSGGAFYLSTPNRSFFANVFDPAWWLIGHRHYSVKQLVDLGEKAGFVAGKVIVNGGFWEIIGINNLYIAKWIFRRAPFFDRFINQKQDEEYKKEKRVTNIFIKFT